MTDVWDSLYDAFASIPDTRVERTRHHSLIDIIRIAMCAVICGADSWVAVVKENQEQVYTVHWALDVTFNEDASRVRSGDGAQNVAVLRHSALNLLRHEARAGSIATKRFRAALDDTYLLRVLQP